LRLLRHRHGYIMEGRPNKAPGDFKTKGNRAGSTFFVAANLVEGTLRKGYSIYTALDEPFARALFIMFLIAEVHPFVDGNGRLSRVMMNAELIAAGQTRILIPSVYRTEYINSLKLLTNYDNPSAFIRVMDQAQLFTSRIDFSNLNDARATLEACNALHDPADNVKLEMP